MNVKKMLGPINVRAQAEGRRVTNHHGPREYFNDFLDPPDRTHIPPSLKEALLGRSRLSAQSRTYGLSSELGA